jgi:hypothetical protein
MTCVWGSTCGVGAELGSREGSGGLEAAFEVAFEGFDGKAAQFRGS